MNKPNDQIKKIVILGGGSAGWMTAAMLAKQLEQSCTITLVESNQIKTVGVGEATIPPIQNFNRILGITETEFLSACNGTIKLGIQFENWKQKQHIYMHPFGRFGADFDYMSFPYFWMKQQLTGAQQPLQEFSLAWHLSQSNKFITPSSDPTSLASNFDYAYHFDAGLYADFLRTYAEKLGGVRIEGKVANVFNHPDNGFISGLQLEDNQEIKGDLFIDCSGQRSVLMRQNLNVPFHSWSHLLFNDTAIAVQSTHTKMLQPYTRSIAHDSGWQWRIPLQTRMGNGNVFSSQFMTDEQGLDCLLNSVDGKLLTEPNKIKFETGRLNSFWDKNCVAIGLSAGFLEPLESTGLHLIQSAIMRLIRLFPDTHCDQLSKSLYNKETELEYRHIKDFIILHYKATERDDSEYWQHCKGLEIPDSLKQQIELFKQFGHLDVHEKDLFKQDNWLAVLTGQGIMPAKIAPIVTHKNNLDIEKTFDVMQKQFQQITMNATSHEMYLAKHCPYRPKR